MTSKATQSVQNKQNLNKLEFFHEKDVEQLNDLIKQVHQHHIALNQPQSNSQQVNFFHLNPKRLKIDQKVFQQFQKVCQKYAKSKLILKYPNQTKKLISSLIDFYLNVPYFLLLEIILKIIGAQTKFESTSKQYERPKVIQHAVIALPSFQSQSQNSIIMLSNTETLKIVTHNANDTVIQQNTQKNTQYFKQDDSNLQKYLQSPFKTVKRQGISDFFTQISQLISISLIDRVLAKGLSQNFSQIAYRYQFQSIIWLQKLIDYISPSLYTYYILHIFNQLCKQIQKCFEQTQNLPKILKKQQYEQIMTLLRSISQRWKDHPQYNNQKWQWQVQKLIIIKFLNSQISQKMLYAVKMIIDRSRRIQYSYSAISQEQMHNFLKTQNILTRIYKPDNHPQIIIKGKQLYEYICKNFGLQVDLINLLFNLIQKSHQNICKSMFITLQNSGQNNLQMHRSFIMLKIVQLPRSSCFYQETFALLQTLILLAPQQQVQSVLNQLFQIIQKNYFNLKQTLRHKAINIYFEVFIMIIQGQYLSESLSQDEGLVGLVALKSALKTQNQILSILMIDKFLQKLKQNFNKRYGSKCKKILTKTIQKLFKQFHIYLPPKQQDLSLYNQKRTKQLQLLKLLMDSYEKHSQVLLQEKQLLRLIEEDSYFGRYIQYYSQDSQVHIISDLTSKPEITQKDIKNLIQAYYMINKEIKPKIFLLIKQKFITCQQIWLKKELVQFIYKMQQNNNQIENLYENFQKSKVYLKQPQKQQPFIFLSHLLLFKQCLRNHDQKGYGSYPAFKFFDSEYSIKIKVINMIDYLKPIQYEIQQKNFKTLYDIMKDILPLINKQLKYIKLKLQDRSKYVTISQLKQKLGQLSPYRQFKLYIESSQQGQCEWYDRSLLITKQNEFNPQIVLILKQIFNHYTSQNNRLYKQNAIKIFQIATSTEKILQNDTRILHLFNNYSQTGQYLTAQQFINFYYQSALVQPHLVIDNIKKLGYGDAFSSASQFIQNFQIQQNKARKFLYDNKCQNIIFQIFSENILKNFLIYNTQLYETISYQLLQLLKQMPVSYSILQKLKSSQFQQSFNLQNDSIQKSWYVNLICLKFYFSANQQEWARKFRQSSLYRKDLKAIYNSSYLQVVNSSSEINPIKLSYNHQLRIDLIQQIGRLLRSQIKVMDLCETPIQQLCPFQDLRSISVSNEKQPVFQIILTSQSQQKQQAKTKTKNIEQLMLIDPKIVQTNILFNIFSHPERIQFYLINLISQNKKLRQIYNKFLYVLSEIFPELKQFFYFQFLSSTLLPLKNGSQFSFQQHYRTLDQLLLLQTNRETKQKVALNLYQRLTKFLTAKSVIQENDYQINKNKNNFKASISQDEEQNLFGMLKCIHILLSQGIMKQKLQGIQFQALMSLFLTQKTRKIIYQILEITNRSQRNINFLFSNIINNTHVKKNSRRKTHEQVGIMNLSCICYINSVLQQLYHIKPFLNNILMTPPLKQLNNQSSQVYFNQFQKIFYQLKYSQRQFIIPDEFCKNYKDSSNNPINIKEQHDADQFLNQLLDRLQKTYVNSHNIKEEDSSIQKLFKGEMANVITCQNCFTSKSKIQDFYVLSLQIKNQTTLAQSLENMIVPQVICDFYCNTCEKKVEAIHKYRKFQALPTYLFIHFQRLVFDLQTFSKIKLDHPVSFPQQIQLQKYFYNPSSQSHLLYKLIGFVVHLGTSQGGHYYSLIKNQENRWMKLNDNVVDKWFWKTGLHEKSNAYLLIYEQQAGNVNTNLNLLVDKIVSQEPIQQEQQVKIGNQQLFNQVKIDNELLNNQISSIQESFIKFLINNLKQIYAQQQNFIQLSQKRYESMKTNPLQASIIQEQLQTFDAQNSVTHECIWKYLEILNQAKNLGVLSNDFFKSNKEKQIEFLGSRLMACQTFSKQIVKQFITRFIKEDHIRTIFCSSQKSIRQTYSKILLNLCFLYQRHFPSYSYLIISQTSQPIKKILLGIQNSLSEVGKNYLKMDEFFQTLLFLIKFNTNNGNIAKYFIANHLPAKFVHFIMQKQSRLNDRLSQYTLNAPSAKKIECFNHILQTIQYLTSKASEEQFDVDELAKIAMKCPKFYKKMINQRYNNFFINKILAKNCQNDLKLTDQAIKITIQGLNRFNHEDSYIYTYIDLLYCLLKIKDQHTTYRTMRLLGVPIIFNVDQVKRQLLSPKQRIVTFAANHIMKGDEIIFPFLELLYTNKSQITYFTVFGTLALLLLIKEQYHSFVGKYIQNLPSPCLMLNKFYSWVPNFINEILKMSEKLNKHQKKSELLDINLKNMVNQISQVLSEIQTLSMSQNQENNQQFISENEHQNYQITQQNFENIQRRYSKSQSRSYLKSKQWQNKNKNFITGKIIQKTQQKQKQRQHKIKLQISHFSGHQNKNNQKQEKNQNQKQSLNKNLIFCEIIYTKPIQNLYQYCQNIFYLQINKQKFQQKLLSELEQTIHDRQKRYQLQEKDQQEKQKQKQKIQEEQQQQIIQKISQKADFNLHYNFRPKPSLLKFYLKNIQQPIELHFNMKNYQYTFTFQSNINSSEYEVTVPFQQQLQLLEKNENEQFFKEGLNLMNEKQIVDTLKGVLKIKLFRSQKVHHQNEQDIIVNKKKQDFSNHQKMDIEQDFPTIQEVNKKHNSNYPSKEMQFGDAFQQEVYNNSNPNVIQEQRSGYGNNLQPNQSETTPKNSQICIECPFCGGFAYEFTSRCPSCGEQWGSYA